MECQRKDKPEGVRTVQECTHGNVEMEPDLEKWVKFLFRSGGRKNILLNYKIVSSMHADTIPIFCSLIALSLVSYLVFLKELMN